MPSTFRSTCPRWTLRGAYLSICIYLSCCRGQGLPYCLAWETAENCCLKPSHNGLNHATIDIKLDKGARAVISAVLKRFPERKWLVTETESAGDLVRRAFKKVGMSVSVNTIRHAQVSAMLDKNPNDIPAVQRTAERFKHSEEVHRKYYRKTE